MSGAGIHHQGKVFGSFSALGPPRLHFCSLFCSLFANRKFIKIFSRPKADQESWYLISRESKKHYKTLCFLMIFQKVVVFNAFGHFRAATDFQRGPFGTQDVTRFNLKCIPNVRSFNRGGVLEPTWAQDGVKNASFHILGPFWVHFGCILGPFWVHFGIIFDQFCITFSTLVFASFFDRLFHRSLDPWNLKKYVFPLEKQGFSRNRLSLKNHFFGRFWIHFGTIFGTILA